MNLENWGENGFIDYLSKLFPTKKNLVGIGDDCAVIPDSNGSVWLVSTDAMVEGIHFIKEQIPPEDLGYKLIAINASDIIAKGGKPSFAFLTLSLPKTTDREWLEKVTSGIKNACEEFHILLLGGDTTGSKRDIFLNIAIMGIADPKCVKYRHGAKTGDILCVTNVLGDSGGGLRALKENKAKDASIEALIHTHFHPTIHREEGLWLGSHHEVHASMDISDGLDCDLQRILDASHAGAEIELSQLPISEALKSASAKHGWDPLEIALTGGEDYCLLLTISPEGFPEIRSQFQERFKHPLYPIGRITHGPAKIQYFINGKPKELQLSTYKHFKEEP